MIILAVVVVTVSFVYDPTMTAFLFSMLPERYKTWPWFVVCLFDEVRSMIIMAAVAVPAFQTQVIAFELVNTSLQNVVFYTIKRYFIMH